LFWLALLYKRARNKPRPDQLNLILAHLVALAGGAVLLLALLVAFNMSVYGNIRSPYIATTAGGEFLWSWQRSISLLSDSETLFVEPGQSILARFPWMVLAPAALLICGVWGPWWLRACVALVTLQVAVYAAFDDLLPNGLFRYINYHYFRWALWLIWMILPAACVLAFKRGRVALSWAACGAAASAGVVAALQLGVTEWSVQHRVEKGRLHLSLPRDAPISYIDIPGLSRGWETTYFAVLQATIDKRPLRPTHDIRALPTEHGTRVVFLTPLRGREFSVDLSGWAGLDQIREPVAGGIHLALGFPRWLIR
jgi:hypothetical protein